MIFSNNFSITRSILDFNMSLDRAYKDLQLYPTRIWPPRTLEPLKFMSNFIIFLTILVFYDEILHHFPVLYPREDPFRALPGPKNQPYNIFE